MEKQTESRLDIPAISYFSFGNPYTGSMGAHFRYRIVKEEQTLSAAVWHTDICFEKAEDKTEQSFPESAEGLEACIQWITQLIKEAE